MTRPVSDWMQRIARTEAKRRGYAMGVYENPADGTHVVTSERWASHETNWVPVYIAKPTED